MLYAMLNIGVKVKIKLNLQYYYALAFASLNMERKVVQNKTSINSIIDLSTMSKLKTC